MTTDGGDRSLAVPRFDVVLRGYDRRQVDEHIARLQRVLARMRADLDVASSQPFPPTPAGGLPAAEPAIPSDGDRPRPTPRPRPAGGSDAESPDLIGSFSDRMQSILAAAEEEAAEIRNQAHNAARAQEQAAHARVVEIGRQRDAVLADLARLRGQIEVLLSGPQARINVAPARPGPPPRGAAPQQRSWPAPPSGRPAPLPAPLPAPPSAAGHPLSSTPPPAAWGVPGRREPAAWPSTSAGAGQPEPGASASPPSDAGAPAPPPANTGFARSVQHLASPSGDWRAPAAVVDSAARPADAPDVEPVASMRSGVESPVEPAELGDPAVVSEFGEVGAQPAKVVGEPAGPAAEQADGADAADTVVGATRSGSESSGVDLTNGTSGAAATTPGSSSSAPMPGWPTFGSR